jgi:hypothetical protein
MGIDNVNEYVKEDVYLCICDKKYVNITCNYKLFSSFIEANNYYEKKYNNIDNNHISTIISTRYIPRIFQKYYLKYKLSTLLLYFDENKKI